MEWEPGQYVTSDRHAEQMAAAAMRGLGYTDAVETPVGPDGGVDVRASGAIAQVKFRGGHTGSADLQRLVGARRREHGLGLYFFTASGYSTKAIEYAEEMDIALYIYDPLGSITPASSAAEDALQRHSAKAQVGEDTGTDSQGGTRTKAQKWALAIVVLLLFGLPVVLIDAIWSSLHGDHSSWTTVFQALVIVVVGSIYASWNQTVGEKPVRPLQNNDS